MSDAKRMVRVSPSTMSREVQGETILLHLDSGEYFGLDATATRVWQLINEKGDLQQVEAAMLEEYEVDPTVLSADLQRVVDELLARGLIEIQQDPDLNSRP